MADALSVAVFGTPGVTQVSLLDVLKQAYGDQVSSIASIKIGYWDEQFMSSVTASGKDAAGKDITISAPYKYWDAAHQVTSKVLDKGTAIPGSHPDADESTNDFRGLPVDNAHFKDISISVGYNIVPNIWMQVEWGGTAGAPAVVQELLISTVPSQFKVPGAVSGAPTTADIVQAAKMLAAHETGLVANNDCHWIAMDIAAAAGATFDPMTRDANLSLNEEGGFWRIAHRGDTSPVDNWQALVQAGDIVRMDWSSGFGVGGHTFTVTQGLDLNPFIYTGPLNLPVINLNYMKIKVVDNTGPGGTIAEHWMDFDGVVTDERSITIYRLTTDQNYLINGSGESETLLGTQFNDLIKAGNGHDTLKGGVGNDTLYGEIGSDTLDGGTGADKMYGGAGSDTYIVDNANDVVSEMQAGPGFIQMLADAGGIDEVRTTLSTYVLPAKDGSQGNIENLTYTGTAYFTGTGNSLENVITGGHFGNSLSGGAGKDTLFGGNQGDTLDGGTEADRMVGGLGSDVYIVDHIGDVVDEGWILFGDASGIDEVRTTLSTYALPEMGKAGLGGNVENLTFIGTGNFTGTGNALDNVIKGGTGMDTLTGGGGKDTLIGGANGDTFIFANGSGQDTVKDFEVGKDVLDIKGVTGVNLMSHLKITDTAQGAKVAFGSDSITLTGIKASQVTDAMFDFTSQKTSTYVGGRVSTQFWDSHNKENWADYILNTDAQGRQTSKIVTYDNGTRSEKYWDAASQNNWTDYVANYDAQGRLVNKTVNNDNGTSAVRTWDVDNKFKWSDHVVNYDAQGRKSGQTINYDNGTRADATWDAAGQSNWSDRVISYDAQGRKFAQTINYDNGTSTGSAWDVDDKFNWSDHTTNYDAQGRAVNKTVHNDNGTSTTSAWDVDNKFNWSDHEVSYDAQGRKFAQTINYDNGTSADATWDAAGQNSWSDQVISYDAQGRKFAQTINYDNGTRTGFGWDAANELTWSDYQAYYDAQGRKYAQTTNYDNNTHQMSQWDVANEYDWSSAVTSYDAQWRQISQSGVYDSGATWLI